MSDAIGVLRNKRKKTKEYTFVKKTSYNSLQPGQKISVPNHDFRYDDEINNEHLYFEVDKADQEIGPGLFRLVSDNYETKLKDFNINADASVSGLNEINLKGLIDTFKAGEPIFRLKGIAPRLSILFWGLPGVGKTHSINQAMKDLIDSGSFVLSLSLDQLDISTVVDFFQFRKPSSDIKTVYVIIEDLGGAEVDPSQANAFSSTSLLGFLDGTHGAWDIPTVILSTTNYPQNFLANIVDRPGRFDRVIEVKPPALPACIKYLEHLLDRELSKEEAKSLYVGVSLAHVKEAALRNLVYKESISEYLTKAREHTDKVKRGFDASGKLGF